MTNLECERYAEASSYGDAATCQAIKIESDKRQAAQGKD